MNLTNETAPHVPANIALVITDNVQVEDLAKRALKPCGCPVTRCMPLVAELSSDQFQSVRLILLSVPVPPMDAVSCWLARTLRARPELAHIPLVLMIEEAAHRERWPDCVDVRATTYITVPFHPLELHAILTQVGFIDG